MGQRTCLWQVPTHTTLNSSLVLLQKRFNYNLDSVYWSNQEITHIVDQQAREYEITPQICLLFTKNPDKETMSSSGRHIFVFPYPAQGHIIPLLDLTHKLLKRNLSVTVLVTPSHLPILQPLFSSHPHSLDSLVLSPPPYSDHLDPITTTRELSKLSYPISEWFKSHPSPPVAIISDMFLGWTQNLASELGVPRVIFWPLGAYASSIFRCLWHDLPKPDDAYNLDSILVLDKVPSCPEYPWRQISGLYRDYKEGDLDSDFFREIMLENDRSWGVVFNSFPELDGVYINHFKNEIGHDRVWAVGPLVPASDRVTGMSNELRDWLNWKGDNQVVYICFGSLWSLTGPQITALANALESSRVSFVWVLKECDLTNMSENGKLILDGFEDRFRGRGFFIKGWAPQVEILGHRAVGVFVTHCGWNSMLEGLCAGVLMLTWPLLADQFYNAKLLGNEIGATVCFFEGGREALPDPAELSRLLDESMDTNLWLEERVRIKRLQKVATEALNGDSSGGDFQVLAQQLSKA